MFKWPKVMFLFVIVLFLFAGSCTAEKQTTNQKEIQEEESSTKMESPPLEAGKKLPPSGGHPVLDFTLQNLEGKKVSLTDYLGHKIVLMNFWTTWCPYCLVEIPHLNKIHSQLTDQVKVLSIDIAEDNEKVKRLVKQKGVQFEVLLDQHGEVARKYRVRGTPTTVVIDKQGNIAYLGHELKQAELVIKELLPK